MDVEGGISVLFVLRVVWVGSLACTVAHLSPVVEIEYIINGGISETGAQPGKKIIKSFFQ